MYRVTNRVTGEQIAEFKTASGAYYVWLVMFSMLSPIPVGSVWAKQLEVTGNGNANLPVWFLGATAEGSKTIPLETFVEVSPMAYDDYWPVDTVNAESFLDKCYKPDRFRGRGEEYAKTLIRSYEDELERNGFAIISHHDSLSGRTAVMLAPEIIERMTS